MFDVADLDINPSPRPAKRPRPRSKLQNVMAGVRSWSDRKAAQARAAPSLEDRLKPIHPMSARLPYRGERHW